MQELGVAPELFPSASCCCSPFSCALVCSMGGSSMRMPLLQCRSPAGCGPSRVSLPWRGLPVPAVPQRCLLWHGAPPPKTVPSAVLSIASPSTCLLCFVSPNTPRTFLLPPFLNWAEVPYAPLTVWRFGIQWVLFIHHRASCNRLWLAEDGSCPALTKIIPSTKMVPMPNTGSWAQLQRVWEKAPAETGHAVRVLTLPVFNPGTSIAGSIFCIFITSQWISLPWLCQVSL